MFTKVVVVTINRNNFDTFSEGMVGNIHARIAELIEAVGLNENSFGNKVEFSRSSIAYMTSGRSMPSFKFLDKVAAAFPDLRMEWLVRGQGDMMKSTDSECREELQHTQHLLTDLQRDYDRLQLSYDRLLRQNAAALGSTSTES